MIIIGEKINGTRKEVGEAIINRDASVIEQLATEQVAGGAYFLDVNAGTHPDREPEDIIWLVQTIQGVTACSLSLDSANPEALLSGIKATDSRPLLNSLSGEETRIEGVLPLASKYKTELVILALDDDGIPSTAEKRLDVIRHLIGLARKGGLSDEMLYVDPLVNTIATDNKSGIIAFDTIRQIKAEFPNVHITSGLSNISFGQPSRTIINQAFATLAIGAGMDSAIVDPGDKGLRDAIYSAELALGLDPDCLRYNQAHRAGLIGENPINKSADFDGVVSAFVNLSEAMSKAGLINAELGSAGVEPVAEVTEQTHLTVGKGAVEELGSALVEMNKARVMELTNELLEEGTDPLAILDAAKAAMSEVGRLFEEHEYFVPELLLAGKMLKDISQSVKPYIGGTLEETEKRGRVLIGTIEGDIHDIGKDIVTTMLEVNGYEVMDLGVDVPVARFVEAAREFQPKVVGLSGFLTLAFDPMKESIEAIKREGLGDIKFIIGGGQIDQQVMSYVGADAFGSDAMEAVRFCNQVMRG